MRPTFPKAPAAIAPPELIDPLLLSVRTALLVHYSESASDAAAAAQHVEACLADMEPRLTRALRHRGDHNAQHVGRITIGWCSQLDEARAQSAMVEDLFGKLVGNGDKPAAMKLVAARGLLRDLLRPIDQAAGIGDLRCWSTERWDFEAACQNLIELASTPNVKGYGDRLRELERLLRALVSPAAARLSSAQVWVIDGTTVVGNHFAVSAPPLECARNVRSADSELEGVVEELHLGAHVEKVVRVPGLDIGQRVTVRVLASSPDSAQQH